MTPEELRKIEAKLPLSKSVIELNTGRGRNDRTSLEAPQPVAATAGVVSHEDHHQLQDPKLEHHLGDASNGAVSRTSEVRPRFVVRIVAHRKRLIDPDNLECKGVIDALRYAGLLPGDTPECVALSISQQKSQEEKTEIEIIELETKGTI